MCDHVCACLGVHVCARAWYMSVHLCAWLCECTCMCVCVHVSVRTCVFLLQEGTSAAESGRGDAAGAPGAEQLLQEEGD